MENKRKEIKNNHPLPCICSVMRMISTLSSDLGVQKQVTDKVQECSFPWQHSPGTDRLSRVMNTLEHEGKSSFLEQEKQTVHPFCYLRPGHHFSVPSTETAPVFLWTWKRHQRGFTDVFRTACSSSPPSWKGVPPLSLAAHPPPLNES